MAIIGYPNFRQFCTKAVYQEGLNFASYKVVPRAVVSCFVRSINYRYP
jgi:hypothetical protein